ncbi:AbrB/MazE/SpoVT family DNA-binding domain-containing protein [Candidatus Uhrbacteria bacterium]|nr:AbrB/MazE/SpoVT family DNA-binding domain-containing protein [Candidatus Uhrbacteria bacterium]
MSNEHMAKPEPMVGSTVVGERGQIVIPKEFRDKLGLEAGETLIVMHHGQGPILLFPAKQMQEFVQGMSDRIANVMKNS